MGAIKEIGLFEKEVLQYNGKNNFNDYLGYIVKDVE
jgi:hypothetical protein